MDLPAEPQAQQRVELLGQTQGALQLMNRREQVKKDLDKAMKFRHPGKLKITIMSARLAQENVRKYVEELLEAMAAAAGVEERERTLQAAATCASKVELGVHSEIELEELVNLHAAIRQGDPEALGVAVNGWLVVSGWWVT
eukprot:Skav216085  [mRNA]  locus=scaffold2042:62971:67234:+ [translate_table: standard]